MMSVRAARKALELFRIRLEPMGFTPERYKRPSRLRPLNPIPKEPLLMVRGPIQLAVIYDPRDDRFGVAIMHRGDRSTWVPVGDWAHFLTGSSLGSGEPLELAASFIQQCGETISMRLESTPDETLRALRNAEGFRDTASARHSV
jgi:hypothetical protein